MRTALLSLMLIVAVATSGAGIHAASSSHAYVAADGYGISSFHK